jgi:hypothetical protein
VTPLSAFALELALVAATRPGVISEVTLRRSWAIVRRGPRDLDPSSFAAADHLDAVGEDMVTRVAHARTLEAEPEG